MEFLPEHPALFLSFMTSNHESQTYKTARSICSPREFLLIEPSFAKRSGVQEWLKIRLCSLLSPRPLTLIPPSQYERSMGTYQNL